MGNLLFSPSGRIGPSAYMKGMIILGVIGFLVALISALVPSIATVLGLVGLVMLYILIALGIKRSHDAGKSGWLSITHLLLSWGVGAVIGFVVAAITGVSVSGMFSAAMSGDVEAVEAATAATQTMSYALISGIGGIITYAVTAYIVNMFNKQDMGDNQYGPVPMA